MLKWIQHHDKMSIISIIPKEVSCISPVSPRHVFLSCDDEISTHAWVLIFEVIFLPRTAGEAQNK